VGPAAQRAALGRLLSAFGLLHLAPVAFVLLSSVGPAPVLVSMRAWSLFFFGHFAALVACGLGFLLAVSARDRVFHGGPLIDFLVMIAGFVLVASFGGVLLHRGEGPSWPALAPGAYLLWRGLVMSAGRPLF
jgi:hypothetical protein